MATQYTDQVAEEMRDRAHDLTSLGLVITERLEGPHRGSIVASLAVAARGLSRLADAHDDLRARLRMVLHEHSQPDHTCSAECLIGDIRHALTQGWGMTLPRDESVKSRRRRVRQQTWRRELNTIEEEIDRERADKGLPSVYGTVEEPVRP